MEEVVVNPAEHAQPGLYLPTASGTWSRRSFLRAAGGGAAALAVGGALAACGGGGTNSGAGGGGGQPKTGGTLTLGYLGGGSADTLDGQNPANTADWARAYALYDGLMRLDNNGQLVMSLAQSVEPDATGLEWTIKIHPNIKTHKGKPYTADDVLYSLRRIIDNKYFSAAPLGPIDFAATKVADPTTLIVKYSRPYSVLREALALNYTIMVPRDFDPKDPDGTGPFKYQSFTPGTGSTFTRNAEYWDGPGPYVDTFIVTNIGDEGSAVNALQSDQVDVVNQLSNNSATVLKNSGQQVYSKPSGSLGMFTTNWLLAPFNDVRVRQAVRLTIDRNAMVQQVFGGQGQIGNDIVGKLDPLYDSSIPQRERDLDQAKALLKEAGAENLVINMPVAPFGPGMVPAAEVLATQLKDVGIQLNVQQQSVTEYYDKSLGKTQLGQDFWPTTPYLIVAGMAMDGDRGTFNQSHQNDPEYNALYAEAVSTLDPGKQKDIAHQMQRIEYDRGGNIVPYYYPTIDASSPRVHGIEPTANGLGPNGLFWANIWVD
ncbi:ABC transporter substrate-binding protein [Mycobacterium sp. 155]|uniref:ABC transporter substrate-binding protein n=1 Tax=Mycobacterium sp. 155 TaxID=1157943 RepID=UPI000379D1E5|nr:ABC transporter substrate-binding protein [Mycobacterium sp. 155]